MFEDLKYAYVYLFRTVVLLELYYDKLEPALSNRDDVN